MAHVAVHILALAEWAAITAGSHVQLAEPTIYYVFVHVLATAQLLEWERTPEALDILHEYVTVQPEHAGSLQAAVAAPRNATKLDTALADTVQDNAVLLWSSTILTATFQLTVVSLGLQKLQ